MSRKPKWGDRRIMESAEGGEFWLEWHGRFMAFTHSRWWPLPLNGPTTKYGTVAEAEEALRLLVKGPQVVAHVDEHGERV